MSKPSLESCAVGRRFLCDARGAVSIFGAMVILLALGLSAFVIDAGHLYLARRRLQSAVDAAAAAAAGNPADAARIAAESLARNGYSGPADVVTGAYAADPALAPAARFHTVTSGANAVRVSMRVSTRLFFARALGMGTMSDIAASATAARVPVASFAAGTALADVDSGMLNRVLGGLLGAQLSLSLASYQALAAANVDALTFLDQLAVATGITAGSYGDLANAQITLGQMIAAARAAIGIHPPTDAGAALEALNLLSLQAPQDVSAALGQLVNTALWQNREIGSIIQQSPGTTVFNLFDLVSAMARVYGAGHVLDLGNALSLPIAGTSVTVKMALGQQMVNSAVGPVGTAVATAQARIALTITLARMSVAGGTVAIQLPLYLQLASGQAHVAAIPCNQSGTMVLLAASGQAASAEIGTVSDAELSDFGQDPLPQFASIAEIDLPLLPPISVNATGTSRIFVGAESTYGFSQADIDAQAAHSVAGGDDVHLFGDIGPSLALAVSGPGNLAAATNALLANTVLPQIRATLDTLLSALDPAVDGLLKTAGLRLGAVDAVVHGVSCGVPTLVR
ncbi:MAG TPA: pilus assembly protein TadG-related protein [Rhizomicrobium sp.]|nr:pilus assembly protein TadG-related protein [Rhizomicrobium sp.]